LGIAIPLFLFATPAPIILTETWRAHFHTATDSISNQASNLYFLTSTMALLHKSIGGKG
jgi:hypothetical protein